jgi:membrane glycosyltransferase
MLFDGERRRACGGAIRLVISSFIEIILSGLIAPILMVVQSGSVFQILLGRDTGWNPQRRDDGSIPMRDIVRRHRWQTVLGAVAGLSAFLISTSLFLWMSPTILGLVLAIPLSWISGSLTAGLVLKRLGLLLTPAETTPPPIVVHANALQAQNETRGFDDADALLVLHADQDFRERHEAMLPHRSHRGRGEFQTDQVMAEAKIIDAASIQDAIRWLKPKERMVVLGDRALLALATRLKS